LIIDFLDVPHMDGSAAIALEEVMERAREEKKHVIIVGMTFSVARMMGRLGALDGVRDSERFDTRAEAVRAAVEFVKVSPGSSRQAI
jgi:anti-anti-sigma regulatory factor